MYQYPIIKPLLPTAEKIYPYLKQIDNNRFYTNGGKLYKSFTRRIAEIFSIDKNEVALNNNGTSGLVHCLKITADQNKKYCILPSWTFPAVPSAVIEADFEPYFIDVDMDTLSITPEIILKHFDSLDEIAAVIAVAPFGHQVDVAMWEKFYQNTGVQVIIDAAASFDVIASGYMRASSTIPIVVSFHATKIFGIGEGGAVICRDENFIQEIKYRSNFGFNTQRDIVQAGVNSKISEYECAVGLAALDEWQEKRSKWEELTSNYLDCIKKHDMDIYLSREYMIPTCNISITNTAQSLNDIQTSLATNNIETRRWWGNGCHDKTAYKEYPCSKLSNTKKLISSVLSIPFYIDLSKDDINKIIDKISETAHNKSKIEELI